jgi:hypothetical protein
MENTPWHRPQDQKRRAFINNFSAAGGNSSLLVEDAPLKNKIANPDPRSNHVVAISAKSSIALSANINSLESFIKDAFADAARSVLYHDRSPHASPVSHSSYWFKSSRDLIPIGKGSFRSRFSKTIKVKATGGFRIYWTRKSVPRHGERIVSVQLFPKRFRAV